MCVAQGWEISTTSSTSPGRWLYGVNDDNGTSDIGEICEAENPKLVNLLFENPGSSQPTPTECMQKVQANPEEYKCSKCPKTYKSAFGLGKHLKS